MISVKNIYWMLAYAFNNINATESEKISKEEFENIYELLCVMLTQELSKLIKRGLYKEYVTKEEELSNLRGKILLGESIKSNSPKKSKMICEYDEYSENSYLNKIIKTSANYLINSGKVKDKTKIKRLKNNLLFLSEVDVLDKNTINWSLIKYTKNNKAYTFAINIAHLIIDGLLANKADGTIDFNNYVNDQEMHKLYEKFILEYYRFHYKNLHASVPQVEWNTDKDNPMIKLLPKMQTDITLYYEDRTLIIDAKYYSNMYQNNPLFDKNTFKSNNLYQIFTYVKNEDKEKNGKVSGMLLYAKTDENDEQWAEYNMDGNKIIISNLDLNDSFDKVQLHLNSIAEKFIDNKI